MMPRILTLLFGATALLAACSDAPESRGEEGSEIEAEPTPNPEAPVSILRPEVESPEEEEEVLLEPLNGVIGFPEGGSELDEAALKALEAILESEQLATGAPIVLRGHSDAGGSDDANERASQARAETVRDWLVENGVAETRLSIITFGEQNPVEPNALPNGEPNEEGRAANRRVELLIVPPKGTVQQEPQSGSAAQTQSATD